jgi:DNA mismatch repair protein MutS2
MMLYPQNLEQKIGFDRIRELLADTCVSPLGRAYVEKMRLTDRHDLVEKWLRQATELKEILQTEPGFPSQNYLDVTRHLAKAAIEGAFLTEEEAFELKISLRTIGEILRFFDDKEPEQYPQLRELAAGALGQSREQRDESKDGAKSERSALYSLHSSLLRDLIKSLDRVIDDRGQLRDDASPELQAIRRQLYSEQAALRKKLDSILKTAKSNGWVNDEVSLTIRNGRLVIPIAAEHKRKIKGFVQDESDTGRTVFLEPADVLDANNEIKELEARERREIVRILLELTAKLRPHVEMLRRAYTFLGIIDFTRAKAKLALQLDAIAPLVHNGPALRLVRARHPLLLLSFQKQGKTVVPLSGGLDPDRRILVVSGPNAGGKSVMLKTIGLLQYMLQCGLLVPVADGTEMGVFRSLFIDIGDEQSLENDLSTYSSHLTNMRQFLARADRRTLFLIDEFGTGTEPSLGGAVAEAILEELTKSGAFGVVNTHYSNLKTFADRTPELVNGAMRFDAEHLEPLYELEIGKPGSSFAFEIAQKIGLPKAVIERARQKLDRNQVNFEKLAKELEIEKKIFSEKNVENAVRQRKLDELTEQYTTLKTYLDTEKKRLLNEAKVQAKQLVKDANARIEQTIREIREQGADKLATKDIRQGLQEFESRELREEKLPVQETAKKQEPEFEAEGGEITIGSLVRVKGQSTVGEVIDLKGKDATVAVGELKTTIKLNRLEKVTRREFREATGEKPRRASLTGIDLNEKAANFSFNLDVRGQRGEEALQKVDSFVDDAILVGFPELRIVHGKGDGILRTLIRDHLRQRYRPHVAGLADEHPDRGGAGVTVVRMK